VHVSALGASVDSQSNFLRSKALGETGLLEGFPSATIMRPASVFGDEDRLFNRIVLLSRHLPLYPLINGGNGLSQPVFCADVAEAIVKAATDPETAGKIYSLCGPKVSSFKDLVNYAFKVINEQPNAVAVPKSVGMAMGYAFEQLPGPWMTRDQLRMQASHPQLTILLRSATSSCTERTTFSLTKAKRSSKLPGREWLPHNFCFRPRANIAREGERLSFVRATLPKCWREVLGVLAFQLQFGGLGRWRRRLL